jgi:hypothetical protein
MGALTGYENFDRFELLCSLPAEAFRLGWVYCSPAIG